MSNSSSDSSSEKKRKRKAQWSNGQYRVIPENLTKGLFRIPDYKHEPLPEEYACLFIIYHGSDPTPIRGKCYPYEFEEIEEKESTQKFINDKARYITACSDQCSVISVTEDVNRHILNSFNTDNPEDNFKSLFESRASLDDFNKSIYEGYFAIPGKLYDTKEKKWKKKSVLEFNLKQRVLTKNWSFNVKQDIPYRGIWLITERGTDIIYMDNDLHNENYFDSNSLEEFNKLVLEKNGSICLTDILKLLRNSDKFGEKELLFFILSCHNDCNAGYDRGFFYPGVSGFYNQALYKNRKRMRFGEKKYKKKTLQKYMKTLKKYKKTLQKHNKKKKKHNKKYNKKNI
tara:strand:+ start:2145 stop:3173 length:1029 start_codon:yes stop_codon:yes gene_type:complete